MASGSTNWWGNVCFRVSSVKMDRRFSIFTLNFSLYDGIINFDLGIYNNLYSIPISCFVAQAQKKKDLLFLPLGRISNSRPWSLYHVCFFQLLINFQSRLIDIRINNRSAVSICISFRSFYLISAFQFTAPLRDLFLNSSAINCPMKVFRFTTEDRTKDKRRFRKTTM